MSYRTERPAAAPSGPILAWGDPILRRMLISRSDLGSLLLLTWPATAIAAALLIAPLQLYSREMTWDLLFNLDGAWRLYNHQIPHVDFHTELGSLTFAMTAVGFHLVGPTVLGFLAGECIFAAIIFALCVTAISDRLPLLPAAIFVVLSVMIALMPLAYGDLSGAFSFAMPYNRFGWSLSGVLFVLLFVEPLDARRSGWKDGSIAFVVLLLLYYVKITYFAVGMAAVAVALFLPGPVRANKKPQLFVFVAAALNGVAPYNLAYLQDIVRAFLAGGAKTVPSELLSKYLSDPAEHAIALAGCMLLTAAGSRGLSGNKAVVGGWFLLAAGLLLLSQNSQPRGIATYAVICLLVFCAGRELIIRQAWSLDHNATSVLLAPLVFPLLLLGASATSLSYYCYAQLETGDKLFVVPETRLRGLAVPLDDLSGFEHLAQRQWSPDLFSRIRSVKPRFELSQIEYIRTLLDFSAFWQDASPPTDPPPRIVTMDRVNALPFVLGLPSPRGTDLWWGEAWETGLIRRPGDEVFADADVVVIPHYPTAQNTTKALMDYYGDYLAAHFVPWRDTSGWLVLRRPKASDSR